MLSAQKKKKKKGQQAWQVAYVVTAYASQLGGIAVMGVTDMFVGTTPSQQRKNAMSHDAVSRLIGSKSRQ